MRSVLMIKHFLLLFNDTVWNLFLFASRTLWLDRKQRYSYDVLLF